MSLMMYLGYIVFVVAYILPITVSAFDIERTWWRLFQKRVMFTKFYIYIVIHCTITDLSLSRDTNSINCGFQTTTQDWKLHWSVCYNYPGFHCLNKSSSHYLAATLFNFRTPCAITQRNYFQYQGVRGDNLIQILLTYQFIILTLFYRS
jgi:hypothetical protein